MFVTTIVTLALLHSSTGQPLVDDYDQQSTLEFLEIPEHQWDRRLGLSIPSQGNGVVKPDDDDFLYVTSSDGRLSILDAASGRLLKSLLPMPEKMVHCKSTVVVGNSFVVYGIQDDSDEVAETSLATNSTNTTNDDTLGESLPQAISMSRMVAVNRTTKEIAWISEPFSGVFAGLPVVSSDSRHIFFTRNTANVAYFTIMESQRGEIILDESSLDISFLTNHNYGPVNIAKNVSTTPYFGGEEGNTNDIVMWHSGGDENVGETQLFQFPMRTSDEFAPHQLGSKTWTVATSPVLTESGGNVYFGTAEGRIRGWVDRKFDLTPNYDVAIRAGDIPTWLEMNDDLFFVSTLASYFYAINKTSMEVLWAFSNTGNDAIVANPVVSPDGEQIYIARGNRMYSKNSYTGEDLWESALEPDDGSDIVANFVVSDMFLYYVGRESNLVTALRISQPAGPTIGPSTAPSVTPTISPAPSNAVPVIGTSTPTTAPTKIQEPTSNRGAAPIAGGVIGAIVLLTLAVFLAKKWLAASDDGIDTNYDFHQNRRRSGVEEPQLRPQAPPGPKPKRYKYDPTRV